MELRLVREDDVTRGRLYLGERLLAYTLEPPAGLQNYGRIEAGCYKVVLTVSGRVQKGTLWSPDEQHRLPLLEQVPGREAIRIHAGNEVKHTQGCILVGSDRKGDTLIGSRLALGEIMELLRQPCYILVEDPS